MNIAQWCKSFSPKTQYYLEVMLSRNVFHLFLVSWLSLGRLVGIAYGEDIANLMVGRDVELVEEGFGFGRGGEKPHRSAQAASAQP